MSLQVLFGDEPLNSRKEIAHRVGCCIRTVVRAEKRGELNPVRLSTRIIRYRRSEVEAWISKAECLR